MTLQEKSEEITLRSTTSTGKYVSYVKSLVFGDTNMGKTFLPLNSFIKSVPNKKVIFINTDQPENFLKNFDKLDNKEKARVIQPHKGTHIGDRLNDKASILSIIKEITTPPISSLIHNGTIGLIVVDTLDVIQLSYETYALEHDFSNTPEMFIYGRARTEMEREFLIPLINLPCNFVATSYFKNVYPEGTKLFKTPAITKVDNVKISVREPVVTTRFWKHFTSIMELRDVNIYDSTKSQINGYFMKSKWFQGLHKYDKIVGNKMTGKGPTFKQLLDYDREGNSK